MPSKTLSRRAFLGSSAVCVGLPLLEAMGAMSTASPAHGGMPRRLLLYFVPNGMVMSQWRPPDMGPGFTLSPILAPLEPVRDELLVISGLVNGAANVQDDFDHPRGTASFATGYRIPNSNSLDNRDSVDQVAAAALGTQTSVPSVQFGLHTEACDTGNCETLRAISWSGSTPLAKESDALAAFDQLFAGFDPGASSADAERRKRYHKSVLDRVTEDADRLIAELGATDRQRVEEYLTGVRELEQKLNSPAADCDPDATPLSPVGLEEQIQRLSDVMVLALQCDVTRVASFMIANGFSDRSHDFVGVPLEHHGLSHHQNLNDRLADNTTVQTWEMAQLGYLLERMNDIVEPDGNSLLHNSVLFCSSDVSDSDAHWHHDMPVVLAGSAGGAIQSGRHIDHDGRDFCDVFTTMLDAVGVPAGHFGDFGSGALDLA